MALAATVLVATDDTERRDALVAAAHAGGFESLSGATAEAVLRAAVGSMTDWLLRLAHGDDDRKVTPHRAAKSSSSERTYAADVADIERIRYEIDAMARANAAWLAKKNLWARTVTIKVRYDDFTTITRSDTRPATQNADDIARRAVALLDKTEAGTRPVRLLGAGVSNFLGQDDPDRLPFETS